MKSSTGAQASRQPDRAAFIGRKVLAGLQKAQRSARALHQRRVAQQQAHVAYLLAEDRQKGRPARGAAGRISRKLGGTLSERSVRRYLAQIIGHAL